MSVAPDVSSDTAPDTGADISMVGLTARDHDMLAFERLWWKYPGSKETAIREMFAMSGTRYHQILNTLIDSPDALAADPMLVKRLRRARVGRARSRPARVMGALHG